jgi:hypothetical protein
MGNKEAEQTEEYVESITRILVHDPPTQRIIRPNMLEGLERYRDNRIQPGSFLRAVLENNLSGAVGQADLYNQHTICAIVSWCYNNMPSEAWGSAERVQAWLS